ncbi:iron uptake protein [Noviherbaspirillum aerium]|uniref:iron uptake protein n=1 Tax=Noviherbaspirillum aerium TaxID=2588497 RepID=UPI00124CF837|nr:iron uptake protein [Noviherbaspirillum aerium]
MATTGKQALKAAILLTLRATASVVGGFGLTTAWVGLGSVALPLLFGMARSEAVLLSAMLGFILYLVLLLWAFAEASLLRVWVIFSAGGATAFGLSRWLASMLAVYGG